MGHIYIKNKEKKICTGYPAPQNLRAPLSSSTLISDPGRPAPAICKRDHVRHYQNPWEPTPLQVVPQTQGPGLARGREMMHLVRRNLASGLRLGPSFVSPLACFLSSSDSLTSTSFLTKIREEKSWSPSMEGSFELEINLEHCSFHRDEYKPIPVDTELKDEKKR